MQDSFEDCARRSNRASVDEVETTDREHNGDCRYQAIYSEIKPEAAVLCLDRESGGDQGGVHGIGKVNTA